MQLVIGNDYGNSVYLRYAESKTKPENSPYYIIKREYADEFVGKYNKQNRNLSIFTAFLAVISGAGGAYINKNKNSKILGLIISAFIGIFAGSMLAHEKNMKLMEKYHVKSYLP